MNSLLSCAHRKTANTIYGSTLTSQNQFTWIKRSERCEERLECGKRDADRKRASTYCITNQLQELGLKVEVFQADYL